MQIFTHLPYISGSRNLIGNTMSSSPSLARSKEALRLVQEGEFYNDYDESTEALGHLRHAVTQMQTTTEAAQLLISIASEGGDLTKALQGLQVACGLKSSTDWIAEREGLIVTDPDGWDRKNLESSMAELITEDQFDMRLMMSTSLVQRKEDEPSF